MVDITVGAIPPVQNNQGKDRNPSRQAPRKKRAKDRRKNKQDRRRSVRAGVVVTLSKYTDRRKKSDRRKSTL